MLLHDFVECSSLCESFSNVKHILKRIVENRNGGRRGEENSDCCKNRFIRSRCEHNNTTEK